MITDSVGYFAPWQGRRRHKAYSFLASSGLRGVSHESLDLDSQEPESDLVEEALSGLGYPPRHLVTLKTGLAQKFEDA